ncbi:MAG TPA: XDD4 family exosortase-dependent surface protein [Vicinamibacterales bacterium]|nr:XDD4 family exosortase-dependent surface protein [Vicinamibacterales bacterium]
MKSSLIAATAVLSMALAPSVASASAITFTGTSGDKAASVTFDTIGTNLVVTLSNTSMIDANVPTDILTGVFFDINGVGSLTPLSAILPAGSLVTGNGGLTDAGNSVAGEWAYKSGLSAPHGASEGISSSGLGLFGPPDRFDTSSNLQGPETPDGIQYGITTHGDNPATGNGGIGNGGLTDPGLIRWQVVFTLSGLTAGFDPSAIGSITNVSFQYGTSLTEPNFTSDRTITEATVPEPTSLLLLGGGLSMLATRLRRRS